ncbi:MAG: T9SS type A sorting domain-containing protein [Flavobacteriales bacterium]|nr:MAG: T9SS type A sorting domain-containing protein [Flavobacteriales bacterium]
MLRKALLMVWAVGSALALTAQSGALRYWDNWYLGFGVGLQFDSTATPTANPATEPLLCWDGCIVSDPHDGTRLFSVHACGIYDGLGNAVPRSGEWTGTWLTALLPHPGDPDLFYLFHYQDGPTVTGKIVYSTFDLSLNGGFGDLVGPVGTVLADSASFEVKAISSPGGNRHWLIAHEWESDEFLVFEVNGQVGLVPQPQSMQTAFIMNDGAWHESHWGVDPGNSRLAIAWRSQINPSNFSRVHLFNLDHNIGAVSETAVFEVLDWGRILDLEFSSNGSKLFISTMPGTSTHALHQIDLSSGDSLTIVNSSVGIEHPFQGVSDEGFEMALGRDGRIHATSQSHPFYQFHTWRINYPDSICPACAPDTSNTYLGNQDPGVFYIPWSFWTYPPEVGIEPDQQLYGTAHAWMNSANNMTVQFDPAPTGSAQLQVIGANGQIVRRAPWPNGSPQARVDMSGTGAGVYVARVLDTKGGTIGSARFVKTE